MQRFNGSRGGHVVDILFTLALFCVFAASALLVVLIGANVYQKTVRSTDVNFQMGTSLTYVSNKIRQNDTPGAVYVGEVEGGPALVLETRYGDQAFQTWIYHTDGALREAFVYKGDPVSPSDGQAILEVASFEIEQVGENLYALRVRDEDDQMSELMIYARC